MAIVTTHESSMKIHDRKLHVLLALEIFSKSVIIYAFQQKRMKSVRAE